MTNFPARDKICAEAERLEQAAWRSAENHITAAGFWSTFQIFWGSAAAVLAAVGSASAFADHTVIAGLFGIAATASAAVLTALRPSERTAAHLSYAGSYHALQYDLHLLRELEQDSKTDEELDARFHELAEKHRQLNVTSPHVPRRLARRCADYVLEGEPYYPSFGLKTPEIKTVRRRVLRGLWRRARRQDVRPDEGRAAEPTSS